MGYDDKSPVKVMVWLWCVKVIDGMEKFACIGPKVHNQVMPKTTSASSIGNR